MKKLGNFFKKCRRELLGVLIGIIISYGAAGIFIMATKHNSSLRATPRGVTISWLPESVKHYNSDIQSAAKQYDIDANLIAIIITLESGGFARANSGVAEGLMQVTDYTGGDIANNS